MHVATGLSVFVHVLSGEGARRRWPRIGDAARAAARLDHPRVGRVLGFGRLAADAEEQTEGYLVAGTPYVVRRHLPLSMWADGAGRMRGWSELRGTLAGVLDALAHAHARDVPHGHVDLEHIGWPVEAMGRPLPVVLDFGLASAVDETGADASVSSAADLRAVAALGWSLALGRPVDRPGPGALQSANFLLPVSVGRWLDGLGEGVYRTAADARRALPRAASTQGGEDAPARIVIPASWRTEAPAALPARAEVAAEAQVFGAREPRLVGREGERDVLWRRLRTVAERRAPAAVVIRGPSGVGKSRLARWLALQVRELGLGAVRQVAFSPASPPGLLVDALQLWLEAADVEERLALEPLLSGGRSVATPEERYTAVARLAAIVGADRPAVLVLDDADYCGDAMALAEHVLRSARRAPVPLLLLLTTRSEEPAEDTPFLRGLLESPGVRELVLEPLEPAECGVLVRQALGLDDGIAARVEQRCAGNPAFAIRLTADMLARGVLVPGLDGLALRPGAVVDLPDSARHARAAAWDRLLEDVERPADARHALEIAAILGHGVDAAEWLAACATARVDARPELWVAACAAGLARPTDRGWRFAHATLREALVDSARSADRAPRWSAACATVVHPHRPGAAARLGRYLLAAGDARAALEPLLAAARARVEATDPRGAHATLDQLRQAVIRCSGAVDRVLIEADVLRARAYRLDGRYDKASRAARRARKAGRRVPGCETLRAEAFATLGAVAGLCGNLEDARRYAGRALGLYERMGDHAGVAATRQLLGWVALHGDDLAGARSAFSSGLAAYLALGDTWGAAEARRGLGQAALRAGEFEESGRQLRAALASHTAGHSRLGRASCERALGILARRQGDLAQARVHYRDAKALFDAVGNDAGVAFCLNGEAEVARQLGDLAAAEDGYRRAFQRHTMARSTAGATILLNLGLVLLLRRRLHEARDVLNDALRELAASGREGLLLGLHLQLCAAVTGEWGIWEDHMERAERSMTASQACDPDTALAAELAGDLARDAGQPERAARCYGLAAELWRRAGSPERAAELDVRRS